MLSTAVTMTTTVFSFSTGNGRTKQNVTFEMLAWLHWLVASPRQEMPPLCQQNALSKQ
jgi:hypothetical protein